jgi:uncharacterized protein (DUF934 family)
VSKLIRGSISEGGSVVEDHSRTVSTEDELIALLEKPSADSTMIVPLALWQAHRERLLDTANRIQLGVLLGPTDDPASIAQDVDRLAVVTVGFPKAGDGRGFSIGRLLRERYRFRGELRAVGDVQRDQMYYMLRCGFDSFALAASSNTDRDIETALTAYRDFSVSYQTAADQPLPLFRRRMAA